MVRERKWLEKLMDFIPGFKGYRKREYIREDDQLLREYLSNEMAKSIHKLDEAVSNLALYDFTSAEKLDSLVRECRILMDKIRWAVHGYAPHYNIVKIKEEDLNKIRDIDDKLIEYVEKLDKISSEILKNTRLGNKIDSEMRDLLNLFESFREVLNSRDDIISGWVSKEEDE